MATRYFCDKCGNQVDGPDSLHDVTAIAVDLGDSTKVVALCRACLNRLRRWLEPDAVEGGRA